MEPDVPPVVVEAVGVWKSYGTTHAVRGVDLSVRAGEIITLLGPNGAGKTTLVEILEGLISPDQGTVRVLGQDLRRDKRAVRSGIGVVLQNHGVDPRIKVREIVEQFATYFGKDRQAAHKALAQFGLLGRSRALVGTLSGGERRKLDLALATIGDPRILFLDEPTVSLDVIARRQVWDAIEALADSGRAIIMTSHQFDEAEYLSDRVIVMVDGRFVLEGPPRVLRTGRKRILRARFSPTPASLPPTWDMDGHDVVVTCTEPLASLHELVGWAEAAQLQLQSLTVDAVPLEEVCVDLFEASRA